MKIKTNELTGHALDYAVELALTPDIADPELLVRWGYVEFDEFENAQWAGNEYHADWAYGGTIIDREGISIVQEAEYGRWQAAIKVQLGSMFGTDLCGNHRQEGPTALTAAMRCFVASRLGEEVDVPDELVRS